MRMNMPRSGSHVNKNHYLTFMPCLTFPNAAGDGLASARPRAHGVSPMGSCFPPRIIYILHLEKDSPCSLTTPFSLRPKPPC